MLAQLRAEQADPLTGVAARASGGWRKAALVAVAMAVLVVAFVAVAWVGGLVLP
jgi:ascorbate-specific PTS system EIIC-type component UlaA